MFFFIFIIYQHSTPHNSSFNVLTKTILVHHRWGLLAVAADESGWLCWWHPLPCHHSHWKHHYPCQPCQSYTTTNNYCQYPGQWYRFSQWSQWCQESLNVYVLGEWLNICVFDGVREWRMFLVVEKLVDYILVMFENNCWSSFGVQEALNVLRSSRIIKCLVSFKNNFVLLENHWIFLVNH